jgi:hypothetical protein
LKYEDTNRHSTFGAVSLIAGWIKITMCYYCGGNHRTIACPIEAQQQTTRAIEKIGYKQSSEINKLALVSSQPYNIAR